MHFLRWDTMFLEVIFHKTTTFYVSLIYCDSYLNSGQSRWCRVWGELGSAAVYRLWSHDRRRDRNAIIIIIIIVSLFATVTIELSMFSCWI